MKIKLFLIILLLLGCENEKEQININVSIDGFKKGKIYLQKIKDSALVNLNTTKISN
jgi:uncharacterized lipoprotein NlpE involved in copper resistance